MHHICLINPWYKYINVNKHLLEIAKQNLCYKVFEIVLLECNNSSNSHQYELAIIECPCLEKLDVYCAYCRSILTATEQSNQRLSGVEQKVESSFSFDFLNDSFAHQSETNQDELEVSQTSDEDLDNSLPLTKVVFKISTIQRFFSLFLKSITLLHNGGTDHHSSQSSDMFELEKDSFNDENTPEHFTKYKNQKTQTKLFAILLPPSPLREMKSAILEAKNLLYVTHSCQVNTLSYLIKIDDNQIDAQEIDHSLSTSFLRSDSRIVETLSTENKVSSTWAEIKMLSQTLTDRKYIEQGINVPAIHFEESELIDDIEEEETNSVLINKEIVPNQKISKESTLKSLPLKCINACDTVDLDEPTSFSNNQMTNEEELDEEIRSHVIPSVLFRNFNNNNAQSISNRTTLRVRHKYYRFVSRRHRQTRNKKHIYDFLKRLHRRKKQISVQLSNAQNRQQASIINLQLNNSDMNPQYKSYNHTLITRATKKHLKTFKNNSDTNLSELIDSQLTLTSKQNCKSVCILIDDYKQYRSSFLHYIYTSLSETLKKILEEKSVELTCMNLAFFNNSLCDIVNMQRLRLIDTGRRRKLNFIDLFIHF